ncbi:MULTISPECIES: YisL family protein [unclassified Bacillus (in: firmicutes)]|uniref:YisL family protein n=1 Tax=unclassified Bacillus (in: firmicutes) TaxID=185979 RepID=UPI0008E13D12|nr:MULTISPECIES: YisL family protein [unclassified Bacillus (in: firmicutes)]SFA79273.1 Protein of unknown function [Bacillus sp. UNCCL13]SFQ69258.1 Protein of unknown function [Bacillus sp. cl95]
MTHAHIFSWFVAIILFLVALKLYNGDNAKSVKIVKMVLRLFYVFILVTGLILIMGLAKITLLYILKAALGVWVIAMMEMILSRVSRRQRTSILWVQFSLALLLVLYLGLKLPLGFDWF